MALKDDLLNNPSMLGGVREGFVIKGYNRDLVDGYGRRFTLKIVGEHFKEQKKISNNSIDPFEKLAMEYCTEMRLQKAITRLKDSGKWLEPDEKNIGPLIGVVSQDILKEEEEEIKKSLLKIFQKRILGVTVAKEARKYVLEKERI
jgi:hypothetical protein